MAEYFNESNQSVIRGRLDNGTFVYLNASEAGHLETEVHGPLSMFGELSAVGVTPSFQADAIYGLSNETMTATQMGGASVTGISGLWVCDSTASTSGLASLRTRRIIRYRPGQGAGGRFTAMYDTPAVGNSMLVGLANSQNSLLFGYLGITTGFGILYGNGGTSHVNKLQVVTASTAVQDATITLNGTPFTVRLPITSSVQETAYAISTGIFNTVQPGWVADAVDDSVYFRSLITGPLTGVFLSTFPSNGSGTFSTYVTGLSPTNQFIPQNEWNVDTLDGSSSSSNPSSMKLVPENGNVYQIKYQYLGFGRISFYVEDDYTGELINVHNINYTNRYQRPSMYIPSYFFSMSSRNTANNTSKKVMSASCLGFLEGQLKRLGAKRNYRATKVSIGTSLTPVFSIKVRDLINGGKVNMNEASIKTVLAANSNSTRTMEFAIIENAHLNKANFQHIDLNSIICVDTTATSYSGGVEKFGGAVAQGNNATIDLSQYFLTLEPNDVLTIVARATSGTVDASISIQWDED